MAIVSNFQPIFSDLKVLELASVLAGPSVGQFFAELGAEVIKVESIQTKGDVTRSWKSAGEKTDDRSAYFSSVNWGKKSMAIDLRHAEGKKIIHQLLSQIDIVIASFKPGDAQKLGVDYKTLFSINPRLIYGQVTGYGSENKRVGYDAVIQAESGFMFMNGELGGASLKMPVALIDILAAHHLKEGILLSLLNRERKGEGAFVEVSLIQVAVASLANQASNWLVAGKLPQKQGSSHPNISPYGDLFLTRDNCEILLAVGNDRQFKSLCTVLGISELADQAHYINNELRVVNRSKLRDALAARIKLFESQDLQELLSQASVPSGLVKNLEDVFQIPEIQQITIQSPELKGVLSFVASGSAFKASSHFLPPPHFGEHTLNIMSKIQGYDPLIIQKLKEREIIV